MESLPIAPHLRDEGSVSGIMRTVPLAALPALIWSVYAFGWRVPLICLLTVGAALSAEALCCRFLLKRPLPGDGSAAVSGLIVAMLLPPAVPLPLAALAAALAVGVKWAFGGLGKNPVNPALTALGILYPFCRSGLTAYTRPFAPLPPFRAFFTAADLEPLAADPTPLSQIREGRLPQQTWYQLLSGDLPGAMGAVSAMLLLAGGVYLLAARSVSLSVPAAYLAGVAVTSLLAAPEGVDALQFTGVCVLSGSAVFMAFFCVTDPVTAPVTRWGRPVYGLLAGVLSFVLCRLTGDLFGAAYAVLIANLAARPLDFLFRPRPYGGRYFRQFFGK
ncbi:MAG: RnfABCDGE type electron transport complex subunit D [Clostridia bacterium]|nr:RnfABCDGE type electron transport complex subunit D [Clostridia bacterium]